MGLFQAVKISLLPILLLFCCIEGKPQNLNDQCTEGQYLEQDCNNCTCVSGQRLCTTNICSPDTTGQPTDAAATVRPSTATLPVSSSTTTPTIQPTTAISDLDLWEAARYGKLELLNQAIASGADFNWRNPDWFGNTALHATTDFDEADTASALLAAGADKNRKNDDEQTPLHVASILGSIDVASVLLTAGADVEAKNIAQRTALHIAVFFNNVAVVELLLRNGADQSAKDIRGDTPADRARRWGRDDLANIIDAYPDPIAG
ncbi:unnamed protein product [Meganyctiphanes norvegica]|uniref:Pacifastin domain-containing protein n=1 Tax=Meganyctiphanes norvegica TaxID=48144 RepID=A0AAV2RMA1_MEGNR